MKSQYDFAETFALVVGFVAVTILAAFVFLSVYR